ncbi:hypothetical protein EJ02DRAFT_344890 [Clathrospora elynae]|uniref:F-box domain-containing protein n=1 Tax=Clathrospora elynae TaxID=706981 RepID=A0A6A5SPX6_9PLEO|nr:hypothetical protein EJ02DRAFT_344890 [Clathrospora elynae]
MSQTIEHAVAAPHLAEISQPQANSQPANLTNKPEDTQASLTKRSEVLRHVFPRPSRSRTPQSRKTAPRVTKADHRTIAIASRVQSRPRVAFHRYFTSFFGSAQDREVNTNSPEARSRASSFGSRPASSIYGSAPSLDVVSPATFVFSGPSLRSIGSYSDSTSRLPSLAESGSDVQLLRRARTDSFSILDAASVIEDAILEPGADRGITRTLSDVLLGISTPSEEGESPILLDLEPAEALSTSTNSQSYSGRDEFHTVRHATTSAVSTFAVLLSPYLETSVWKALRVTNRSWYLALSIAAPPRFPASYHLPVEIVQYVYDYLSPKDFNAARHTCRAWMRASLDKKFLNAMLGRGGWLSSTENSLHATPAIASHPPATVPHSDEWSLSRRLARQCALSSAWTGNGLDIRPALVESSEVDFTELTNGYIDGLIFATSVCGRFLCVARDTLIYIYDLDSGHIRPVTSVVCPRRVLEMSMDVSTGRHAMAALLEGRMGMVCELRYGRTTEDESPVEVYVESDEHPSKTTTRTSILTSHANEFEDHVDLGERNLDRLRRSSPYVQERDPLSFNAINVRSNHQDVNLRGTDDHRTYDRHFINHTWNLDLHGPPKGPAAQMSCVAESCARGIPLENGTSTFYRHLCSEDDPPRSVSICPQRRCVAFGCSAGIELHWIDALTGQSLSRWFPLTAPSDYLYFLSPRPGFESAKKLRLISSAAHPEDRPAISRKFFFGRPTVSSFWGSFGFESASRRPGSPSCDHYHAIPLSDGHHVLFIDPAGSRLTLGCDAPLGGPTKLLRKVVFIPPEDKAVPRIYSAAADLSQGVRVVVAYGDSIMLYSVPPDVCGLSRLEQKAESWDIYNAPPFSTEGRKRDHWLN